MDVSPNTLQMLVKEGIIKTKPRRGGLKLAGLQGTLPLYYQRLAF